MNQRAEDRARRSHPGNPWLEQVRSPRVSLALLAMVAVASACWGRWSSPLLLAGLGGFLAMGSMVSPPLGLVALITGSLLSPLAVATGSRTDLNFTVLVLPVLIGCWGLAKVYRRDWRLWRWAPVPPLLAFAGVATLAFALSKVPWLECVKDAPLRAQLGGLAVFLLSAGAFLLTADVLDRRWLMRLTWLFLGVGGIALAGHLTPELSSLTSLFQTGATGSLFWTWLVALAFGQVLFNRDLHLEWRVFAAWVVVVAFYVTLAWGGDWMAGWFPPLVAVAAILWIGAPRLALVLTLVAIAAAALRFHQVVAFVASPSNQYSLGTRLEAWRIVAEISAANPLLGLGPATYYHCTPLYPIRWYHVHFSSHNTVVDIVAQTGLVGLGCFVWFVWREGWLAWELREQVTTGFERAYVYGVIGGLAGTLTAAMLADWLLPFVYNITLAGMRSSILGWLFLGGLVAVARNVRSDGGSVSGK